MKTIDEMIAVMQAAKEGKKIQASQLVFLGAPMTDWKDCAYPEWNWVCFDYRVKPEEPKIIFVNWYKNLKGAEFGWTYSTRSLAEALLGPGGITTEFIQLTPEVRSKLGL